MLTRNHPHARDLLRKWRPSGWVKGISPSTRRAKAGHVIGIRANFGTKYGPCPMILNRREWRRWIRGNSEAPSTPLP